MLLARRNGFPDASRAGQDCQVSPAGGRLPAFAPHGGLRRLADEPPPRLHARFGRASKRAGRIEIRKDKPYVLDFATKPEVHFRAPSEGEIFKPGDQIWLAAVLRIPHKGLMIGGLEDMGKKTGEIKWTAEDGKQMTSPRYASLEPTVVITDSSGKKVAEGTMPFG